MTLSLFNGLATRDVLRSFKEGQSGWPVAAFQLNLAQRNPALAVDGEFGPKTKAAVVSWQQQNNLTADGVAGPATCRSLCLVLTSPYQDKYRTPHGLARGVIEGESAFDPACVSAVYSNDTRDIGAWQDNISQSAWSDDERLKVSFNISTLADATLAKVRAQHDRYRSWGCDNTVAWQLGVLFHNRPADADALARASVGRDSINWTVISDDNPSWYCAQPGLCWSHRAWVQKYIQDKTRYITTYGP